MIVVGIPSIGKSPYLPALLSELALEPAESTRIIVACNGNTADVGDVWGRMVEAGRIPKNLEVAYLPGYGIYAVWNYFMDEAAEQGATCVILNDDVMIDHGSIRVADYQLLLDWSIVGWDPDAPRGEDLTCTMPVYGTYRERGVTGYAFAIDPTLGVRCDERFRWWGGDDDLVYTLIQQGHCAGRMKGVGVQHWPSTSSTARPEVLESVDEDRELLLVKHGRAW